MGPLAATALVAFAGVSPVGPVAVNSSQSVGPGTELIDDTQHAIPIQGNIPDDLSYSPPMPPIGPPGVRLHPADGPIGPFRGNLAIEPRPADERPLPGEPRELLWLVMFSSLATGGIVALRWRLSGRSG